MDHEYSYSAIIIARKLKQIVCNYTIYTLEDAELLQFPGILSLLCAHGRKLPFLFSELNDDIMAALDIEKRGPRLLEVINVHDLSRCRVGCTTTFSDIYQDYFMIREKGYLKTCKPWKRNIIAPNSSYRTRRPPHVYLPNV